MRTNKNLLAKQLSNILTTAPHYIGSQTWLIVKSILQEYSNCLTDKLLRNGEIEEIANYMNVQLNVLSEMCDATSLYDCYCYVYDALEFCKTIAIEGEKYESAENTNKVLIILGSKVQLI